MGAHAHHGHHGHHHGHDHSHAPSPEDAASMRPRLLIAFSLAVVIVLAQAIGSLVTGSLALLTDTAHAVTDASGLLVALTAASLMTRPATSRRTWGFRNPGYPRPEPGNLHPYWRYRALRSEGQRPHRIPPRTHRLHLPGVQPGAHPHRGPEH